MTPRIKTAFQTTTPESVADGDFAETGWVDEKGDDMSPEDEDETAVANAVRFLRRNGARTSTSVAGTNNRRQRRTGRSLKKARKQPRPTTSRDSRNQKSNKYSTR